MTERERQQQDARLDALVDEVAWAASRYGEAKAHHGYGDQLAAASDAMQEAVDRLHEYIAEVRQPAPAVSEDGCNCGACDYCAEQPPVARPTAPAASEALTDADRELLVNIACVLVPLADRRPLDDTASIAISRMPKYWQRLIRDALLRQPAPAASEDTARLDWLEQLVGRNESVVLGYEQADSEWSEWEHAVVSWPATFYVNHEDQPGHPFATLRAAIDAARGVTASGDVGAP